MKRLIYSLLLLLATACAWGNADVRFSLVNFQMAALTNKTFWMIPLSTPTTGGGSIISNNRNEANTGNGTFILSNVFAGTYRCEIRDPDILSWWKIEVPSTNGVVDADGLIVVTVTGSASTNAMTLAAARALFVLKQSGWSVSQILTGATLRATFGDTNLLLNTDGAVGQVLMQGPSGVFWGDVTGGGGGPVNTFNPNQFDSTGVIDIKSGVLLTNVVMTNGLLRGLFTGSWIYTNGTAGVGSNVVAFTDSWIAGIDLASGLSRWVLSGNIPGDQNSITFGLGGVSGLLTNGGISLADNTTLSAYNSTNRGYATFGGPVTNLSNTELQVTRVQGWNMNVHTGWVNAPYIVPDGDSLSTSNFSGVGTSYPEHLSTNSNYRTYGLLTNYAISGTMATNIPARYLTTARTVRPGITNGDNGTYLIWAGINDIRQTNTAVNIYLALSNVWRLARFDGYKVLAFTVPIWGDGSSNATTYAIYTNLNTLIKSDRGLYDGLVDADALFPWSTSTRVGDLLHLDSNANRTLARYINTNFFPRAQGLPQFGGRHVGTLVMQERSASPDFWSTQAVMQVQQIDGTAGLEISRAGIQSPDHLFLQPNGGEVDIGILPQFAVGSGYGTLNVYSQVQTIVGSFVAPNGGIYLGLDASVGRDLTIGGNTTFSNLTASRLVGTGPGKLAQSVTPSAGLLLSGANLSLDINALTADPTPDGAADYLLSYDASAGAHKKVLFSTITNGLGPTLAFNGNQFTIVSGTGINISTGAKFTNAVITGPLTILTNAVAGAGTNYMVVTEQGLFSIDGPSGLSRFHINGNTVGSANIAFTFGNGEISAGYTNGDLWLGGSTLLKAYNFTNIAIADFASNATFWAWVTNRAPVRNLSTVTNDGAVANLSTSTNSGISTFGGASTNYSGLATIQRTATSVPFYIQGAANSVTDLLQVANSSAQVIINVRSNGIIEAGSMTNRGSIDIAQNLTTYGNAATFGASTNTGAASFGGAADFYGPVRRKPSLLVSTTPTNQIDFSLYSAYRSTNMLTNFVLQLTNMSEGSEMNYYFTGATNGGQNYTVYLTVPNPSGVNIHWGQNSPTNGATSFTVTNNTRATMFTMVWLEYTNGVTTTNLEAYWQTLLK